MKDYNYKKSIWLEPLFDRFPSRESWWTAAIGLLGCFNDPEFQVSLSDTLDQYLQNLKVANFNLCDKDYFEMLVQAKETGEIPKEVLQITLQEFIDSCTISDSWV